MKTWYRILALVLCLTLLSGCAGGADPTQGTSPTTGSDPTTQMTDPTADPGSDGPLCNVKKECYEKRRKNNQGSLLAHRALHEQEC